MPIRQKINQELQNDSNLEEIEVYKIDGRSHGFLYDKINNKIIVIEESKDLINEEDLPEFSKNGYEVNQQGLKELFDDILE
jgi:hypothetical protein